MDRLDVSNWFFPMSPRPAAAFRLFGLSFAGGGAGMYRRWAVGQAR